eukprot:1437664-Rhodomonas_salina.2
MGPSPSSDRLRTSWRPSRCTMSARQTLAACPSSTGSTPRGATAVLAAEAVVNVKTDDDKAGTGVVDHDKNGTLSVGLDEPELDQDLSPELSPVRACLAGPINRGEDFPTLTLVLAYARRCPHVQLLGHGAVEIRPHHVEMVDLQPVAYS